MKFRACAAVLIPLCAACASPSPKPARPDWSPSSREPLSIRYVGDVQAPPIGKEDLERARALLERARKELQPRQWELLDQALSSAERAWAKYQALAGRSGTPATVPRAFGLVGVPVATADAALSASAVGPLLLALGSLWPAPLGSGTLPAWQAAELDFEASLREVVKAAQEVATQLETDKGRPPQSNSPKERRPECLPVPVSPHAGGDKIHDVCADVVPPNRFPEHDVIVNGVRFDAIEVNADVLWEVKTERFDTYSQFLQNVTIEREVLKLQIERTVALACGYDFVLGVSSAAQRDVLRKRVPKLEIRLTEC